MNISVWSTYFRDLGPEQSIDAFLEGGLCHMELSDEDGSLLLERGQPQKVGREFRSFLDDRGFSVPQGHLKLRADLCRDDGAIDEFKRWLDLFYEIGIKAAVLHFGGYDLFVSYKELVEIRANAISQLAEHVKGTDMFICLENIRGCYCSHLLELIDAVGSDNMGICLDTGHLNLTAEKQSDFIHKAGGYLKALHIADNQGATDQHLMPFGIGTVDWPDVMRALKETGYHGLFNFEIPGETFGNIPLEVRKRKLKYIKSLAEFMLSMSCTQPTNER